MPHWWKALALLLGLPARCWPPRPGPSRCTASPCMAPRSMPPGFAHFPYVNPSAPKGGRLVLGTLGTFDSLNPFIIKGVTPGQPARLRVREPDDARRRRAVHALRADRGERGGARRPQLHHLPSARGGPLLRRRADHARGRALQPCAAEGEGLALSPVALRQGGERGEDRPAQRALHVHGGRRPRDPADPRADADPAAPQARCRDLRPHHAGAAGRQRTLHGRPRRRRPLPHLSPQPRLVGARPARDARALQLRRDPRSSIFRDAASLFEAFKAGEIDVRAEDDPGRWIEGYDFPAVADGRVIKREFDTRLPSGMPALVFNTRRPMFADARVRRAFILLFDAEWINRSLFNGVYQRTQSFFERSELSSHGRPADARRARAAGSLRPVREAGGAGRHLSACPSPTAAARTAPACRRPSSSSPRPAGSRRAAVSSRAAFLSPSSSWPRRASRSA